MVFLQQLSNGVVIGVVYSLMAIGLSLIFGIMRLINFSHGEFYMLGAYISFYMCSLFNISPLISLFIAMVTVFLVGLFVEGTVIKYMRLKQSPLQYSILLTFGISIFFQNFALIVFGPTYKRLPPLLKGVIQIGPIVQSKQRLLILCVGIILMIMFNYLIKKTKLGLAMRATAQSSEASMLIGIDVNKIYMATFGIGSSLAAAGGSLIAPMFFIYPTMGMIPISKSFVVIILGGLGSIQGAVLGGIIIGITETITCAYISAQYEAAVAFLIMILILVIKPTGLLGQSKVSS